MGFAKQFVDQNGHRFNHFAFLANIPGDTPVHLKHILEQIPSLSTFDPVNLPGIPGI